MPIFKCFFKIVVKNRVSLFVNIGVFAALMIIFTSMGGSELKLNYSQTSVDITVINRDGSELSEALIDYLDDLHNLKDIADDTEKLQDALFYRDVEYILTIPDGFGEAFLAGGDAQLTNVKLPGSASGVYVDNQIDRFLATANAYLSAEFDLADAISQTADDLRLDTTIELYKNQTWEIPTTYYYFGYLSYILIAIIIAALGSVLIAFHKHDLRRRMDSSALTLRSRNAQTALGCVVVSFALWVLFMLAALVVYGQDMFTVNVGLQVLNSLAFLAVCISIAFLLGLLLQSENALGAVTNAIALGMSFLCGVFVVQELLGKTVLAIAKFLPAYWYVRSNDMLALTGTVDMVMFREGILVQLGFAIAIFAVSLVVSQLKRDNLAAA